MKTLLAPVDFSEASVNAVLFAAELSRRLVAGLVIVNIVQKDEDESEVRIKLDRLEADVKRSSGPT